MDSRPDKPTRISAAIPERPGRDRAPFPGEWRESAAVPRRALYPAAAIAGEPVAHPDDPPRTLAARLPAARHVRREAAAYEGDEVSAGRAIEGER